MHTPTPFLITFTKPVVFKDRANTITHSYEPGDVIQATAKVSLHYVTAVGGIYDDEARPLHPDELVTYAHVNGDEDCNPRFRQYAKDPLPAWATSIKLD
jgi:hypothetical protein